MIAAAAAPDVTVGLPLWVEALVAVGGTVGVGALLRAYLLARLKRLSVVQTRADAHQDAQRAETREIAQISAASSQTMLDKLTGQIDARLDDYKTQIAQMRQEHAAEISELRKDNKQLERRVQDLQSSLNNYQMGIQVPRGMVLIPLADVREMRSENPGVLPRPWYVGEDDTPMGSIDARITPLPTSSL